MEQSSAATLCDDGPTVGGSFFVELGQVAAVLAMFALLVAWPLPEANEAHYLGKTKHQWQPDWVPNDFFYDAADGHPTFTWALGWLSYLPRDAYAWTVRWIVWALEAFAWCRLWNAISARRWLAPLAAGLFVLLAEQCEMAGEWAVGGAEAKGVAYAGVFLGMAALARTRWNAAWIWFGAASSFHVLVGGWSVLAAGVAWLAMGRERPSIGSMLGGLSIGLILSLPGLSAALLLTAKSDPDTVRTANMIYVYRRLAHHLDPTSFQPAEVVRAMSLMAAWIGLAWFTPRAWLPRELRWFTHGTIVISAVGWIVSTCTLGDRALHAALMKFYWFRLADVLVPAAVALLVVNGLSLSDADVARIARQRWKRGVLVALAIFVSAYTAERFWTIATVRAPRSFRGFAAEPAATRGEQFADWRAACAWIAEKTPPEARFLTPRMESSFKWYSARSEVATWKDVPQDAASLLEWRLRLREIYRDPGRVPQRWVGSLNELSPERLHELGDTYDAAYLLVEAQPRLALDLVYQNNSYAVYRLDR
ncbi:MAG: hypothetical protein KF708_04120 [Pirellulales bacterium]|nr:hypothetical protein [Pirellulales bacterium]